MSRKLLIGIDGTGSEFESEQEYLDKMKGGFISSMCRPGDGLCTTGAETAYFRGPRTDGLGSALIAAQVLEFIRSRSIPIGFSPASDIPMGPMPLPAIPTGPLTASSVSTGVSTVSVAGDRLRAAAAVYSGGIFLAGYSRGGHIAVEVARRLGEAGVRIKALFLFDAVDRVPGMNSWEISRNVDNVYHAIRHRDVGSRWYFGHTGLDWDKPDDARRLCRVIDLAVVKGTHAALGGFPYSGDTPRSGNAAIGVAAAAAVHAIGMAARFTPDTRSTLASVARDLFDPRTVSPRENVSAARETFDWMRAKLSLYQISWNWTEPAAGNGSLKL